MTGARARDSRVLQYGRFTVKGNRTGAAYVLALTTLVVGVTFAMAMLQSSGSHFLTQNSQGLKERAADLAWAGIDYADIQVNKHGQVVPHTFPRVNLSSGSFDVTVTDVPGTATMLITSTGTVRGTSYTVRRIANGGSMDRIIDNLDPAFSCSSWSTGTMSADKYSTDYRWHSTQMAWGPASWTVTFPVTGNYDVYAWWPEGTNRSNQAPYILPTSTGQVTVIANQQQNGGKWNLLGRYHFNSGSGAILLSFWAPSGFVVCADAVRVQGPYQ